MSLVQWSPETAYQVPPNTVSHGICCVTLFLYLVDLKPKFCRLQVIGSLPQLTEYALLGVCDWGLRNQIFSVSISLSATTENPFVNPCDGITTAALIGKKRSVLPLHFHSLAVPHTPATALAL